MVKPAHIIVLEEERRSIVSQIDVLGTLLWEGMMEEKLIGQSQLNRIKEVYHTNQQQAAAMLDHLQRNEDEKDFETFLFCLEEHDHGHVARKLRERLKEVKGRGFNQYGRTERDVSPVLPSYQNEGNYAGLPETAAASGHLYGGPRNRMIDRRRVYDIGTEEKGNVIIINYTQMKTQRNEIKTREGCENDVRKMRSLFRDLGFNVRVFENLVYGDLISNLTDFAFQADRDNIKSVFVMIMAHGGQRENKQYICTHDGRNVFIEEEIRNIFDSANVPTLARKPKIFIIQACRGEKEDDGVFVGPADMETEAEGIEPRNGNQRIPRFTDYLFAFPTQQDHVSYRNTATGSPYLQELDLVFREESSTMHVVDMLTVVLNNFIHSQKTGQPYIQSPETVTGLSKFFYIFPERLQNS